MLTTWPPLHTHSHTFWKLLLYITPVGLVRARSKMVSKLTTRTKGGNFWKCNLRRFFNKTVKVTFSTGTSIDGWQHHQQQQQQPMLLHNFCTLFRQNLLCLFLSIIFSAQIKFSSENKTESVFCFLFLVDSLIVLF